MKLALKIYCPYIKVCDFHHNYQQAGYLNQIDFDTLLL